LALPYYYFIRHYADEVLLVPVNMVLQPLHGLGWLHQTCLSFYADLRL